MNSRTVDDEINIHITSILKKGRKKYFVIKSTINKALTPVFPPRRETSVFAWLWQLS